MKRKIIMPVFALMAVMGGSMATSALAENGGGPLYGNSKGPLAPKVISSCEKFTDVRHVANGVALRNKKTGTIHLRGIPSNSNVLKAYLYWSYIDKNTVGAATSKAKFGKKHIIGDKIADNFNPGWKNPGWVGDGGTHTYRYDVTTLVNVFNNANRNYAFRFMDFDNATSGENPFDPADYHEIKLEGASLLVIYTNATLEFSTTGKQVFLYDKCLNNTGFNGYQSLTLKHPNISGEGLFTMCGADGQRGLTGYDNGDQGSNRFSNEKTFFNGIQIAGPPVAASDWDGSAGLPLPQLWDVHTHSVGFGASPTNTSALVYKPVCEDACAGDTVVDALVPVFFVLEK